MRSLPAALAALAAAAVLGAVSWLLLRPAVPPSAPPPPPPAEADPAPAPVRPAPPVFAPPPPPAGEEAPPPEGDPAPAPGAWPGEVPAWWREMDGKFREKEMELDDETRSIAGLAALLQEATGVPVTFDGRLREWSEETRVTLARFRGPARALVETLASRFNVEAVLGKEGLRFHQRGTAPEGPATLAGRVQWAVLEAVERHRGIRPSEEGHREILDAAIDLPLERVPLREAARRLGERLSLPVYLDAPAWNTNPLVTLAAGERPVLEALEAMTRPWDLAWDVGPRSIVVFKPPR